MTWRDDVLAAADAWLLTPWHHRARVRGAGVDCGQYIAAVFEEAGVLPHVEVPAYSADFMLHRSEERFLAYIETYFDAVDAPQPADVVMFRFGKCFSHAAVVVAWPRVIHSYRPDGGVVYTDASMGRLAADKRRVKFYSREARL